MERFVAWISISLQKRSVSQQSVSPRTFRSLLKPSEISASCPLQLLLFLKSQMFYVCIDMLNDSKNGIAYVLTLPIEHFSDGNNTIAVQESEEPRRDFCNQASLPFTEAYSTSLLNALASKLYSLEVLGPLFEIRLLQYYLF
ncbi:hypothetical protein TNCV_4528631 [Trichonephila clavipes]|nr:hypothetical protein TNCV_4528631 [Trichonephila clavipes]